MRVLWLDAKQNPWTESSGFTTLEDFGLNVERVTATDDAVDKIKVGNFDLFVVCAEVPGAIDALPAIKKDLRKQKKKIILCSSEWGKSDFKQHAKTSGAAHRYAHTPMPVEGFLGVVAELCECSVDELRDYKAGMVLPVAASFPDAAESSLEEAQPEEFLEIAESSEPSYAAPSSASVVGNHSEDVDVLRKYLHMKEEQVELLSAERNELHKDNTRLQKEAQELQIRIREAEYSQEELARKIQQMEASRDNLVLSEAQNREHLEFEYKNAQEKLKTYEAKLKDTEERYEGLKVRLRKDIRKIRANERDLEARMEIIRKDSETLLGAREQKLLELQRKVDALEFDLDQVQDSRVQAEVESERYLAKLSRVSRALHIALGMIESDHTSDDELDALEPMLGGAAADATEEVMDTANAPSGAALPDAEASPEAAAPVAEAPAATEEADPYAHLANDGEATRVLTLDDQENSDDGSNQAIG